MTATDWTAAKIGSLESELKLLAVKLAHGSWKGSHAEIRNAMLRAALALQTQRNLLAAANARIAELETECARLRGPRNHYGSLQP